MRMPPTHLHRAHPRENANAIRPPELPWISPRPRLAACTLAASSPVDAELSGEVRRAAGSTKNEEPTLAEIELTPTAGLDGGWPVNLRGSRADNVHANSGPAVDWAWVSVLVCQLGVASSSVAGAVCAVGRSLPAMKLAFALMAAINGSTGSWATLSSGLSLPHHASPASARRHRRFSSFRGGGASAARDAVL